jgi:heat shock protein HslJ
MIRLRSAMLMVFVSLFSLAACTAGALTTDDPLDGTSWELFAYRKTKPIPGTTISADFAESHIRGSAGCNHYGAAYQVDGERITVGEIELTAMACLTPEGAMEQEQEFMRFLTAVQTFKLTEGQLQLLRPDGEALTFLPPDTEPADPLRGTSWELVAIGQELPISGTTLTVTFKDGQVDGSTGCNAYFGAYSINGEQVTLSGLGMTEMACLDPAGVMDQELTFLQFLSDVQRFHLAAGELQLLRADGEALRFRPQ